MGRTADVDTAIRCADVSISRSGGARVIDGVSFVLSQASTLAVMGPTGAGKSSLVAALAGSTEDGLGVAGGEAQVCGISVRKKGRSHRVLTYSVGYLEQGAGSHLPARMTVGEVIGAPITSRDRRVNQKALAIRVATLLDEMKLPLGAAGKYPYELSAGMRQRVAFARAVILQPRLLIADEPLANLDIEVRHVMFEALTARRRDAGMAALIVTNDKDFVRELDADALVLGGGHVVAQGRVQDMQWTPSASANHRLIAS